MAEIRGNCFNWKQIKNQTGPSAAENTYKEEQTNEDKNSMWKETSDKIIPSLSAQADTGSGRAKFICRPFELGRHLVANYLVAS